jgi:hypothetical protein
MPVIQSTQSPTVLVAIDVAKLRHEVLVQAPGSKSRKRLVLLNTAIEFRRLADYLHGFKQPVRIGFEATGNYHRPLAHFLHRPKCIVRPLIASKIFDGEAVCANVYGLGKGGWQIQSRNHFYAIASLAMRRVLIDFGRARMTQRRGRGEELASSSRGTSVEAVAASPESLVQIGMLMDSLEKTNKEWARVVDMHYFAGFTLEEIAEISGLTLRQIRVRWEKGRDWLKDHLL